MLCHTFYPALGAAQGVGCCPTRRFSSPDDAISLMIEAQVFLWKPTRHYWKGEHGCPTSGMKWPLSGTSGPVGKARPLTWPLSAPQAASLGPRRPRPGLLPSAFSGSAARACFWVAAEGPCPESCGSAGMPTSAGHAGGRRQVSTLLPTPQSPAPWPRADTESR